MFRKPFLICLLLLLSCTGFAQPSSLIPLQGILPFTGIRFFHHGLGGEDIEVLLEEDTWTSNRLPINKDFEIKLIGPTGLAKAEDGNFYPGVEVLIQNTKKDTLAFVPNIFGTDSEGLDPEMLKSITLSLGFNEMSKPGDTCLLFIKFFDTQSSNHLKMDFPVVIADPSLPLETTNSTYRVRSSEGYNGISTGVDLKKMDMHIEESTKSSFIEFKIYELYGMTEAEYKAGKSCIWVYDEKLNVSLTDQKNVTVKAAEDGMNITLKMYLKGNERYARFRWENADHTKVIDLIGQL